MDKINPDNYKCVSCGDVQFEEVYICKSEKGHWICSKCFQSILDKTANDNCPACREPLSIKTTMFFDLKPLFKDMKAECQFVSSGCKEILLVSELNEHEKICKFSLSLLCPCNNIPSCRQCRFMGNFDQIFKHMPIYHKFNYPPVVIESNDNRAVVHMENVKDIMFWFIKTKDEKIYCFVACYTPKHQLLRFTLWSFEDHQKYLSKKKVRTFYATFINPKTEKEMRIKQSFDHVKSGTLNWFRIHEKTLISFMEENENFWKIIIEIEEKPMPRNKKKKVENKVKT